jgi:hypothetical protein
MSANPMDSIDPAPAESINACFAAAMPAPCSDKQFARYTTDLKAIWAKIFEIRAGRPTVLRAIDAANPFAGAWKENHVLDACNACWSCTSTAPRQAAEAYHIPFVSRYDAFNGINHDQDPAQKGYVGIDGIHPSDSARQLTAKLLGKLGYAPVPPPQ